MCEIARIMFVPIVPLRKILSEQGEKLADYSSVSVVCP